MNLIECFNQIASIMNLLDAEGGEITPAIEEALDNINATSADKIDRYAALIAMLPSQIDALKAREKEINAHRKGLERVLDRLKTNAKAAASLINAVELCGNRYAIKFSPSKASLIIENESELPAEFKKTITEVVPDKEHIRTVLESGEPITGCYLQSGLTLRVKEYVPRLK